MNIIISEIICPIMNLLLFLLFFILITFANTFTTEPAHDFVTLDTTTDPDFAPLMSADWTQRLPEDIRKYKDQVLAKLHIAHHEHKRNERVNHRLQIL